MDSEYPIDAACGDGACDVPGKTEVSGKEPLPETNEFPLPKSQANNPLHGVTLEQILVYLVENFGWIEMNRRVEINCFYSKPSIKSSLTFLRKNNWARIKVERLYLEAVAGPDEVNRDWHG